MQEKMSIQSSVRLTYLHMRDLIIDYALLPNRNFFTHIYVILFLLPVILAVTVMFA